MPKPDAKEFDEYMAKHAAEIEGGKQGSAHRLKLRFPNISPTELKARIDLENAKWDVSRIYYWVKFAGISARNLSSGEGLRILARGFRQAAELMEKNAPKMDKAEQIIQSEMKKRRK